jgi:hypothetical protein
MCAKTQLIIQLHECASIYMRVSIAAFRPKKAQRAFFACFGWPNTVRAMPYQLNDQF